MIALLSENTVIVFRAGQMDVIVTRVDMVDVVDMMDMVDTEVRLKLL